jgi:hypothetical protein
MIRINKWRDISLQKSKEKLTITKKQNEVKPY